MKPMPWPQAIVITSAILVVGLLAVLKADTEAVMTVILIVLGGLGYGQLATIKEQTNGTQSEQLRLIRDLADKVAAMQPPASDATVADAKTVTKR